MDPKQFGHNPSARILGINPNTCHLFCPILNLLCMVIQENSALQNSNLDASLDQKNKLHSSLNRKYSIRSISIISIPSKLAAFAKSV
jgi:hypothetical protein